MNLIVLRTELTCSNFDTETHLRDLLKSQHDKIEEIKKATNYYSTRDLLEKYDELVSRVPGGARRSLTRLNVTGSLFARSHLELFSTWISRNTFPLVSSRRYSKSYP